MSRMKKYLLVIVISGLLLFPGIKAAAARKGATVVVSCAEGKEIKGELISVNKDAQRFLVLPKDDPEQIAAFIEGKDIEKIQIVKRSQVLLGMLAGCAMAEIAALALWEREDSRFGPDLNRISEGGILLISCLMVGAGIGAALGKDITIDTPCLNPDEWLKNYKKFNKLARVPNPV